MPYLETSIGAAAAFCTTVSYIPQLKKTWQTGATESFAEDAAPALSLWMLYGFMRADTVILIANGASLTLLGCILYFKPREQKPKSHSHNTREPVA